MKITTLKDALWAAQGGKCWICGGKMKYEGSLNGSASLDHLWPKSAYKAIGDIGVTLLAHRACNVTRGAALPDDEDIRILIDVYTRLPREFMEENLRIVERQLESQKAWRVRGEILRALLERAVA